MLKKKEFVNLILKGRKADIKESAIEFACANIALCKYWGKRNAELNLPLTDSLSISMDGLGTKTKIKASETGKDTVFLNEKELDANTDFASKVIAFTSLLKPENCPPLEIKTENNIPTGAGVASSASGFAALTKALNSFFGYNLSEREQSLIANIGSGSASRSIYTGFVYRHAGVQEDGMDSYSEKLPYTWPELKLALLTVSDAKKKISSGKGMNHTVKTSVLYKAWPEQAKQDMALILKALEDKDFELLGQTAENNALAMHACMMASNPPLIYWESETLAIIKKVQELRQDGLAVYLTIDAGPNVKLLFEEKNSGAIKALLPGVRIV